MKKAFSKILVLVLTVSMLLSMLSVGISAANPATSTKEGKTGTIQLSQVSSIYAYTVIDATITGDSAYKDAGVTWSLSGQNIYVQSTTSLNRIILTSTYAPANVTVKATSNYDNALVAEMTNIIVVPMEWSSGSTIPPYWFGYDFSDFNGWTDYNWFGTNPFGSNVVYVDGVAYPWCGASSSANCTSNWCVHNLMRTTSNITYDTTYCSWSACQWCGNPFNHHTLEWFINGGKSSSSTNTSTTTNTTTKKETTKLVSAVERLAEYRKSLEEKGTTAAATEVTKKATQKYINIFKDVNTKSAFYDCIRFVMMNEYMKGDSTYEFGVNTPVTRAEFVEVLGKFADVTTSKYTAKFDDVSSKAGYAPYAAWAVDNGFMTAEDGKFSPNHPITNQDAAQALYSYIKSLKLTNTAKSTIDKYSDAPDVAEEYKEALDWALSNGIMTVRADKINPTDAVIKVRLAQMLYSLDSYID